jgi:hypothetical protein
VGSGPPRQGQGSGAGADTAIEWLPTRHRLRHAGRTTGWASGMKAALASAAAAIVPMMLGAVPASAANLFVANQDPTAQDIRIDRSATIPLNSIPSATSSAVCTPPPVEPATITVTGMVGKVGQPEVYTVALLGTCYIPPDSVRPTGTAIMTVFTDPRAKDMASHITDVATAPPPATNLVGVRAPDGASVFSGPADAASASRIQSRLADINDTDSAVADSVAFTYPYSSVPGTSGARVQRNPDVRAGAMTVTVAKFGDYGMAGPVLDRFGLTAGDRYQPADASASHYAPGPSSVFITQSDSNLALPADDFGWHVGVVAQTPNPNSVGTGSHPSLSATVSRHGASPGYTNVLAGMP